MKILTTPEIYNFITRETNIAKGAYDLDESSEPHASYLCNFMMYQLLKSFSSSNYFAVLMAGAEINEKLLSVRDLYQASPNKISLAILT